MDNKLTHKEMLRATMYKMFKDNNLPNLDMEDFLVMWQSLANRWGIVKLDDDWDEFAEEINCVASNREQIFNEVFDKHFL
jgi:hypothetical protein